jgi:hypothetical protein
MSKAHCKNHRSHTSLCSLCREADGKAKRKFGYDYSTSSRVNDDIINTTDWDGDGLSGGFDPTPFGGDSFGGFGND